MVMMLLVVMLLMLVMIMLLMFLMMMIKVTRRPPYANYYIDPAGPFVDACAFLTTPLIAPLSSTPALAS